jgi:AcrR family transcriptional regulator
MTRSPTPPDDDSAKRPKRLRRTPESARRAILDAAAECLKRDGPDGLRLQSIAADVGISHTSILHHFGSREGLLEALAADAFEALDRDLRAALESTGSDEARATSLLERVARTLRDQGHARLLGWQIMSGRLPRGEEDEASNRMLERIAEVVHRVRLDFAQTLPRAALDDEAARPTLEDTRFFVLMLGYTLFAEAFAGETFMRSAGLEATSEDRNRFLAWLAERSESMILLPRPPGPDND